jgi:hypothetical protein
MYCCISNLKKNGAPCKYEAKYDNNTHCGYHKTKNEIKKIKKNNRKQKVILPDNILSELNSIKASIEETNNIICDSLTNMECNLCRYISATIKPLIYLVQDQSQKIDSLKKYIYESIGKPENKKDRDYFTNTKTVRSSTLPNIQRKPSWISSIYDIFSEIDDKSKSNSP